MAEEIRIRVRCGRDLPSLNAVVEHLWGAEANVDSDGDSCDPDDRRWTELSLELRSSPGLRVDVDPIELQPLVLEVRSTHEPLARKLATYLAKESGGSLIAQVV
jgi:hypothetical protein